MSQPFTLAKMQLKGALETLGLHGALEYLNGRVAHRYTVVYRFDGDAFYGMAAVDKLREPIPSLFNKVTFEDSYCQYTVFSGEFRTEESLADSRLDGHIHQRTVQSYTGLPLKTPDGRLYGTFCHLDLAPQTLDSDEYEFLLEAAEMLSHYLPDKSELIQVDSAEVG